MFSGNDVGFNSLHKHKGYEHLFKIWCTTLYQRIEWEAGIRSSKIMQVDMKGFL